MPRRKNLVRRILPKSPSPYPRGLPNLMPKIRFRRRRRRTGCPLLIITLVTMVCVSYFLIQHL